MSGQGLTRQQLEAFLGKSDPKALRQLERLFPTVEQIGTETQGAMAAAIAAAATAQTALADAATAQSTADGKITAYWQATEPTTGDEDDLWFDTDSNNEVYILKSGIWVSARDSGIVAAITAAATAQGTADGKSVIYYQATEPTGLTAADIGDQWVDTAHNNRLSIWSGTAFILAQDWYVANAHALEARYRVLTALTDTGNYDGEVAAFGGRYYQWSTLASQWDPIDAVAPSKNGLAGLWRGDELPDMPDDSAGVTYQSVKDWTSGVDGWTAQVNGTVSVVGGCLRYAKAGAGGYLRRAISFASGATLRLRARYVVGSGTPIDYYLRVGNTVLVPSLILVPSDGSWSELFNCTASSVGTSLAVTLGQIANNDTAAFELQFVYVGTGNYLSTVVDNSGNGMHGTPSGVTPVDTIWGRAINFDKINDYVALDINKDNWTGAFTWAFRVQGKASRSTVQYAYSRDTGGVGGRGIRLFASNANNRAHMLISYDGTNYTELACSSGTENTDDCTITFEFVPSTSMRILKDGVEIASKTTGVPALAFWSAAQTSQFGAIGSSHIYTLDGWLSAPMYHKRALTASEHRGYALGMLPDTSVTGINGQWEQASSDGVISPVEKKSVLSLWKQVDGDGSTTGSYWTTRAEAISLGVSVTALANARSSLYAYLYTSPGVLAANFWPMPITVDKDIYNNRWSAYTAAETAVLNAIAAQRAQNAETAANAAVSSLAPRYRGIGQLAAVGTAAFAGYTVSPPTFVAGELTVNAALTSIGAVTPNVGDYMVNFSGPVTPIGVYKFVGGVWTQNGVDAAMRAEAIEDIWRLTCLSTPITISEGTTYLDMVAFRMYAKFSKIVSGGSIRGGDRYDEYGNVIDSAAAGFILKADGNAEFNNVLVRGILSFSNFTAGSNIVRRLDDELQIGSNASWTKVRELQIAGAGTLRVSYDARSNYGTISTRVYINGTAVGTTHQQTSGSYATFDEDFVVAEGDLIQVYQYSNSAGAYGYIRNFRLKIDQTPGLLAYVGNP